MGGLKIQGPLYLFSELKRPLVLPLGVFKSDFHCTLVLLTRELKSIMWFGFALPFHCGYCYGLKNFFLSFHVRDSLSVLQIGSTVNWLYWTHADWFITGEIGGRGDIRKSGTSIGSGMQTLRLGSKKGQARVEVVRFLSKSIVNRFAQGTRKFKYNDIDRLLLVISSSHR